MERGAPAWVADYLTIPFLNRGRSRLGADCWGLVWIVSREQFGRHLPSLDDAYFNALDPVEIARLIHAGEALVPGARQVAHPREGSIAVIRSRGVVTHTGIYIGAGHLVHTDRGCEVSAVRVDHPMMRGRIVRWYDVD